MSIRVREWSGVDVPSPVTRQQEKPDQGLGKCCFIVCIVQLSKIFELFVFDSLTKFKCAHEKHEKI